MSEVKKSKTPSGGRPSVQVEGRIVTAGRYLGLVTRKITRGKHRSTGWGFGGVTTSRQPGESRIHIYKFQPTHRLSKNGRHWVAYVPAQRPNAHRLDATVPTKESVKYESRNPSHHIVREDIPKAEGGVLLKDILTPVTIRGGH